MIRANRWVLTVSFTVLASHVLRAQPLRRAEAASERPRLIVSAFMVRDSLSRLIARLCNEQLIDLVRESTVRVVSPTELSEVASENDAFGPATEPDIRAIMKLVRLDAAVEIHAIRSDTLVEIHELRFRRDGRLDSLTFVSTRAPPAMIARGIALLISRDSLLVRRTP
jgi:hypothetical protein